jgi:hypothetical protein
MPRAFASIPMPGQYLYAATEKRTRGKTDPNDTTSGVVYHIEPAE